MTNHHDAHPVVVVCCSCHLYTPDLKQSLLGAWRQRLGRWRSVSPRWGNGRSHTRPSVRCVRVRCCAQHPHKQNQNWHRCSREHGFWWSRQLSLFNELWSLSHICLLQFPFTSLFLNLQESLDYFYYWLHPRKQYVFFPVPRRSNVDSPNKPICSFISRVPTGPRWPWNLEGRGRGVGGK